MAMKMVNRYERVEVFSPEEYRRRIEGIQDILKEKGLDMAVFLECSEETYSQWMLGVRFLEYIIVPAEGEVTGVLWNELDESGCDETEGTDYGRYFIQKPITPVCDGIHFVNHVSDAAVVLIMASMHPHRVGWIAPKRMTAAFADALEERLPHIKTTDISVDVAVFRAVKSPEELKAIQISRDIQARVFDALPLLIKEGRTADEITSQMRYMLAGEGASGVLSAALVNDGPTDDNLTEHSDLGARKIKHGDRLFAIFEACGAGQQHVAFGRHLVLREPDAAMLKAVSDEIAVHKFAASQMKADGVTTLAQIAARTADYAASLGYTLREEQGWNWMHSMGAFIYEQFSVEDYTENVPLAEGCILHCHPLLYSYHTEEGKTTRREVFILNTYRVTREGPEDLINIPFEPVILDGRGGAYNAR